MGELSYSYECEDVNSLFSVERLHNVPFLIDECCDLINLEWKRSKTARLRSIENSSENFPMSLVLIRNNGKPKVAGHCKISKLPLSNTNVFVETVVIHPELRRKGLGKYLMNECEKGQECFYKKLGYNECPPVSIYGCATNDSDKNFPEKNIINNSNLNSLPKNCWQQNKPMDSSKAKSATAPPLPPPPPPLPILENSMKPSFSPHKTFMKKEIV